MSERKISNSIAARLSKPSQKSGLKEMIHAQSKQWPLINPENTFQMIKGANCDSIDVFGKLHIEYYTNENQHYCILFRFQNYRLQNWTKNFKRWHVEDFTTDRPTFAHCGAPCFTTGYRTHPGFMWRLQHWTWSTSENLSRFIRIIATPPISSPSMFPSSATPHPVWTSPTSNRNCSQRKTRSTKHS